MKDQANTIKLEKLCLLGDGVTLQTHHKPLHYFPTPTRLSEKKMGQALSLYSTSRWYMYHVRRLRWPMLCKLSRKLFIHIVTITLHGTLEAIRDP